MSSEVRQFQVDAFANRVFEGNPAAVCPLPRWLDEAVMQAIAAENNLSETAFFVPAGEGFELRWFTPLAEVDLCGHATLATAHVLFENLGYAHDEIRFESRSGELTVRRQGDLLEMDFPSRPPIACAPPDGLTEALGAAPLEVLCADDLLAVFGNESEIRAITPDFPALARLPGRGVCVTAPGDNYDFVSRFFAPALGVSEDPVTGSAHCELAPYWAGRLGRTTLRARQVSRRGGEVGCEVRGERVLLSGTAVTFMEGTIRLP
jgi:PhzF family phenazine biosynthesis protein